MSLPRTFRRAVTGSVLALVTVVAVSTAASSPASASDRHGCTGFGPGFSVQGVGVKDGTECVFVSGQGLRIDRLYASFLTATTRVCNWWIDLDTNAERPEFKHFQGGFHNGCTKFSGVIEPRPGTFGSKPGRVCATLFSDAVVQARSCLSIHT